MPGSKGVKRSNSKIAAGAAVLKIKRRRESKSSHASHETDDLEIPEEDALNWSERWGDQKGTLLVAGQGEVGQLGLGEDITDRKKFVPLPELGFKIVAIAAGGMHSAALDDDGTVWTFGCNDEGALGRLTSGQEAEAVPGKVILPGRCVALSAGDSHTTALLHDGRLMAWGSFRDSHGSMGLRMTGTDTAGTNCREPVELLLPNPVSNVASGADHIVALTNKRHIYSLGCAEQGQLGRMPARSASRNARNRLAVLLSPMPVGLPRGGQKRGGSRSSTPLDTSTTDMSNSASQDALPSQLTALAMSREVYVWAGSHSSFMRAPDGNIYAWGLNNYSQLGIPGNDTDTVIYKPQLSAGFNEPPMEILTVDSELTTRQTAARVNWTQIACGLHHTIALDSEGRVYAVGRREYGRLGLGAYPEDAPQPILVPKLKTIRCVAVAASTSTSLAVSEDGGVYAWGMGNGYALGTGEEDDCLEPVRVSSRNLNAMAMAIQVSAGDQHSMALVKGSPTADPPKETVATVKQNGNGTGESTDTEMTH